MSIAINPERRVSATRLIAACTIGNALEFYDFVVFSLFARLIGELFFPNADPTAQLLSALVVYGIGFLSRPLGGIVLGAYADRKGRKKATILTLMLMATGTVAIGLAPTYAQVGVLGPIIVVCARLLQGFSAGGEVGASTTLLAESAPPSRRGFFGAWQLASQGLGVMAAALTAMAVYSLLSPDDVRVWGWRMPFLLGVVIVPIGLWLRSVLHETHANEAETETRKISSLRIALSRHLGQIVSGIGLVVGGTAATAVIGIYMSTYAVVQLKFPPQTALLATMIGGMMSFVTCPIAGAISDRIGRKPVVLMGYIPLLLLIYPAFLTLNAAPTMPVLLGVIAGLAMLNAFGAAAGVLMLVEQFPAEVRATGMSLVYAVGVAIFGGFAQAIVTWLIQVTGSPLAPAYYVVGCSAATLVALTTIPDKKGKTLD